MIDYKELVDNLEVEKIKDLIVSLGAENYLEKDNCYIFPTICHNDNPDEASMKLYLYKDTKLFVCYTECGNMSIFSFLKHYYETRGIDYDWYRDILEVVENCSISSFNMASNNTYHSIRDNYKQRKERKELEVYPEGILQVFEKIYPVEWTMDNISDSAMDKFNILYSSTQNKIIIPHYNINNQLIGIRGRALNEWEIENVGKYMPVQIESKWYSHPLSLNLYGLNRNKDNIKRSGMCYLVEAEKSVLQAESFKRPNCTAAVCGSKLNKYMVDLLVRECQPKEIIVAFDNEEESNSRNYFNKLYEMCSKYKNYCNISFIYDRDGLTGAKQSPTDNGEKIFEELIKRRVKI